MKENPPLVSLHFDTLWELDRKYVKNKTTEQVEKDNTEAEEALHQLLD